MLAILIIIPTVILISQLVIHKFTYKITKKYWFTLIIAIFFLLYFLIFRYIPDFLNFLKQNMEQLKFDKPYEYSFFYSKILLLDMCPLLAFLIPLSLIFDKTMNFAKCLAPIGLIGSLITLYGGVLFDNDLKLLEWNEFYKYLFFGTENDSTINRIYFMMHLMLMIISIHVLLNCKQYTKWSIFSSIIFYLVFVIYAIIISKKLEIINNVTGLVKDDWEAINGEYHTLYTFIPLSFPGIVIFWYFWAIIGNLLICYIKNYLTSDLFKITKYNKKFYEKIKVVKIRELFRNLDKLFTLDNLKKFLKISK